jgi:hypothetical protein
MCYDFIGVVADFIKPIVFWNKRKRIYCSKALWFVEFGFMRRISPRLAYKKLKEMGWTEVPVLDVLSKESCHV